MEQFEKVIHLSCNALIVDGTRWVRSSLYNQLSKDCRRMQYRIASRNWNCGHSRHPILKTRPSASLQEKTLPIKILNWVKVIFCDCYALICDEQNILFDSNLVEMCLDHSIGNSVTRAYLRSDRFGERAK